MDVRKDRLFVNITKKINIGVENAIKWNVKA